MNDEFRELISCLKSHNVEFMVVGAYALAIYLEPRATQDLDLWLKQSSTNIQAFGLAMQDFGIPIPEAGLTDFLEGRKLIRIGVPPNQVDFLSFLGPAGAEYDFEEVAARNVESTFYGFPASFPSAEDILASKLAANRPKDQGDIAQLRKLLAKKKS